MGTRAPSSTAESRVNRSIIFVRILSLLIFQPHYIAEAADCMYKRRVKPAVYLVAQVADVHIDDVGVILKIIVPNVV